VEQLLIEVGVVGLDRLQAGLVRVALLVGLVLVQHGLEARVGRGRGTAGLLGGLLLGGDQALKLSRLVLAEELLADSQERPLGVFLEVVPQLSSVLALRELLFELRRARLPGPADVRIDAHRGVVVEPKAGEVRGPG
jgi:hypothetical protein